MESYQIEVQSLEDVSGEQHYKFKGGRDIIVMNVKSEAEAVAVLSLHLHDTCGFQEVMLPDTAKLVNIKEDNLNRQPTSGDCDTNGYWNDSPETISTQPGFAAWDRNLIFHVIDAKEFWARIIKRESSEDAEGVF